MRLRLCSALPRRLRRGSRHRHLRLLRARWSRPGRPRALARKLEAGEARAEEEGIRAEVRAPGHRHPRAHSSGRTKGRHWGRSPSASGPTWAPLPRSASRPPRPAHCAGACGRQVLAGGERGRTAAANPEQVPPLARRAPSLGWSVPLTLGLGAGKRRDTVLVTRGGNACLPALRPVDLDSTSLPREEETLPTTARPARLFLWTDRRYRKWVG